MAVPLYLRVLINTEIINKCMFAFTISSELQECTLFIK